MTIRSFVFWPHLIAGVSAGLVVLVMSVTGVLLTYERQMIAWSDRGFTIGARPRRTSPPPDRDADGQLLRRAPGRHADSGDDRIRSGRPGRRSPCRSARCTWTPTRAPCSARGRRPCGESCPTCAPGTDGWPSTARAGPLARAITGWSNVIFLFIVVSGFYLWFPRKWTLSQVKAVTLFKGGLRGKARDFNWHNVIGVWSAVPLFIVVLSAMPISFPWANALVYQVVGEPAPPTGGGAQPRAAQPAGRAAEPAAARGSTRRPRRSAGRASGQPGGGERREDRPREAPTPDGLNALWTRAEQHVSGWRTINMRIPNGPAGSRRLRHRSR